MFTGQNKFTLTAGTPGRMGSYATPPDRPDPPDEAKTKLGDLLSGRLADVEVDSVEAVREEREPR